MHDDWTGTHARRCPGEGSPVGAELEARREVRGGYVAERDPIEAALNFGGQCITGSGLVPLDAGVTQNRILTCLEGIGRAGKSVASRIEAARVVAQRQRRLIVETALRRQ